jgi:adenosine deaminase
MPFKREFLAAIPKSELHVHLDGSIRPDTLIELARNQDVRLPSYNLDGLRELVFKKRYAALDEYLKGFVYTVAVLQDEESLERVSYELAEDCTSEGIRYMEVRFAPQLHMSPTMSIEQVLKSIDKGLARHQREFNSRIEVTQGNEPPFQYGMICCAMRMFCADFSPYFRQFSKMHPFSPDRRLGNLASQELALAVVKVRDRYGLPIVGFDLAGSEAGYPAGDHTEAFKIVHQHFMKKTVHAGEAYGPESIFQAITDLYADRIGHGYHLYSENLINDPAIDDKHAYVEELSQYIADRRITLEVCLTSNKQTMPHLTDWQSHSFQKFLNADLSVSLCVDNRTVSDTTLTDELVLASTVFPLTRDKLKNIVIYGFKRSFFPDNYSTKREYVRKIIDYYEKLEEKEFAKDAVDQSP